MRHAVTATLRSFRREPFVPALVVLTLALGLGLSGAMAALLQALVFRPLPFAVADRLVDLQARQPQGTLPLSRLSTDATGVLRGQRDLFEAVEQYQFGSGTLVGVTEPRRLSAPLVTPGLLTMLGAAPLQGRLFVEDDRAGAPVALISESLWRGTFGGDRSIVGRRLLLDDERYEIIGVLPASFRFPDTRAEIWRPLAAAEPSPASRAGRGIRSTVALLAEGIERPAVDSALATLSVTLQQASLLPPGTIMSTDRPLQQRAMDRYRPALFTMFGAVVLVLLMAAINVVNLLLVRGAARQGEFALLTALGAPRSALAARIAIDALLLGAAGAVGGLILSRILLAGIVAIQPEQLGFLSGATPALTPAVVGLCMALSALVCLGVSLLPSWRSTRIDALGVMQRRSGRVAALAGERWQSALLMLQLGMIGVVLALTGALTSTFVRMVDAEQGYVTDGVMVAEFTFSTPRYLAPLVALDFLTGVDAAIESALPGARSTVVVGLPPYDGISATALEIDSSAIAGLDDVPITYAEVADDYFDTMGIAVTDGRPFLQREAEPVVIIDERMAQRFWGTRSPIGARLRYDDAETWRTVVGVVANVKATDLADAAEPSFRTYVPFSPGQRLGVAHLVVRSQDSNAAIVIRAQVRQRDADVPVRLMSMQDRLAESRWQPRFFMRLSLLFAAAAIVVAGVGVYGVAAYQVTRRRREIAVRMAVGATPSAVARLVLNRALVLAFGGMLVAIPGATALASVIRHVIPSTRVLDPLVGAGAAAILLAVVCAATLLPAIRAARTDPSSTLNDV